MRIAAVVIWYYPQKDIDVVSKVLSYAHIVKVYIVDNSPTDNAELAEQIPRAQYIPNFTNVGIAAAQNIGCKQALNDGFEWVMIMDQDSFFEAGQAERYLREVDHYAMSDEKSVSFSLYMKDDSKKILPLTTLIKQKLKTWLKGICHYPSHVYTMPPIDHPDRVFASANIVKLSVWQEIGAFDELLFIDEVDFDFCIRLHLKGYHITRFNNLYLNHKLGNRKFTVFPKASYHSGKRLYYIIRNKLIENRRYRFVVSRNFKKEIGRYFKDYCLLDWKAPKNWLIFTRAYFDYRAFIKTDATFRQMKEKGLTT